MIDADLAMPAHSSDLSDSFHITSDESPRPTKVPPLVLVDFENLPNTTLKGLDADARVIIYLGPNQKMVPIDLAMAAQTLGSRLQWRRIPGVGNNALDFFIACELGRILETARHTRCTILSKDKGYDPLLKHLNALGLKCKRLESLNDAPAATEKSPAAPLQPSKPIPPIPPVVNSSSQGISTSELAAAYQRTLATLKKSEKSLPSKKETLEKHISAMHQNKISAKDIQKILSLLITNRRIAISDSKITYSL